MSTASIGKPGTLALSRSTPIAPTAIAAAAPRTLRFRLAAVVEAMGVFFACQWFLWHHSGASRNLWLLVLAYILLSVWRHGYSLSHLGLRPLQDLEGLRWLGLGAGAAAVPVLAYGVAHSRVVWMLPDQSVLLQFAGYTWWCLLQQFALQSFMHNRLADAARNRHFNSLMLGVIFGALHLPNPVLTIATFAGGIAMGEVFSRFRNIYVLALGQALVSTVILVSLPDAWHHRLRVGSGFYPWQLTH